MREIDGSYGEGGGQLLRTACALAAITGEAVRLRNVRARRDPPGLAPQHLTAVRAVAALCGAEVDGLALRSREIAFRPGRPQGGEFRSDVGTAGCLTLVLQALLPVAISGAAPVRMHLVGGTDIRRAPPLDYLRFVLLPLLGRMGARVEIDLIRRGYYPRGGGEIAITVRPSPLQPLRAETGGAITRVAGLIHVANLPAHIGARMHEAAVHALEDVAPVRIEQQLIDRAQAVGQGGAIVLWASGAGRLLGAAEVAQRGVPAERIAQTAAQALRDDISAGATLDIHASDQLLIYTALAQGPSCFLARALTSHARTALWLLQQFFPLRVHTGSAGGCTRVDIDPGWR